MKSDKYIGCDLHQATTVVAVLDGEGKVVLETIIATEAAAVIRFLKSLSGPLHITFEETTQARWMYDVVRGYVSEATVCDPRRNKLLGEGSKADKPDARKLAELLRAGLLRPVYHGHEATRQLKELVRGYETLSGDTQRMMVGAWRWCHCGRKASKSVRRNVGVFLFCLNKDRNVRICVFPNPKEVLVGLARLFEVPGNYVGTRKTEVGNGVNRRRNCNTTMIQNLLKLGGGFGAGFG